jgi:hypothetical protein
MSKLYVKAIKSAIFGIIAFAAFIFLPAGTLNYWQGWVFLATFVFSTLIITVYLARHDPKLLERRISVGPQAEKEPAQKVIATLIIFLFAAILVFSALDWRFQWSPVAPWVSIAGDALIFLSYLFFIWVFRENSYGASTIQIAQDQKSSQPAHTRLLDTRCTLALLLCLPAYRLRSDPGGDCSSFS